MSDSINDHDEPGDCQEEPRAREIPDDDCDADAGGTARDWPADNDDAFGARDFGLHTAGPALSISPAGIALIKKYEGCRLTAYRCPAGVLTIGYGWTQGVTIGDCWTQAKADEMLVSGVKQYEDGVTSAIRGAPTTQHQFDAMVSLCYNIGPGNFARSSLVREHIAGHYQVAAAKFLCWDKAAGRVLPGLCRRRKDEEALYLSAG